MRGSALLLLLVMTFAPTAMAQRTSLVDTVKAAHAEVNVALSRRKVEQQRLQQAEEKRDAKAAQVQRLKRSNAPDAQVAEALRAALVLDESVSLQRGQLAAADGEVAESGAQLLSLYDQLLLRKRKEVEQASTRNGQQRALQAYRLLSRRRDELRRLLQPALQSPGASTLKSEGAWLKAVRADDDDDVETLLEKADLARDLEERYLRRAAAVRRRIRELEQERALAKDVLGLSRTQGLFDENDRRLQTGVAIQGRRLGGGGAVLTATADEAGGDRAAPISDGAPNAPEEAPGEPTDQAAAPPPSVDPSAGFSNDDGALEADGDVDVVVGGEADRGGVDTPTAPTVQTPAPPVVNEEVFVNLDLRDNDLERMLDDEHLSLQQLKALEKKLQQRAKRMKSQSKELQSTANQR